MKFLKASETKLGTFGIMVLAVLSGESHANCDDPKTKKIETCEHGDGVVPIINSTTSATSGKRSFFSSWFAPSGG